MGGVGEKLARERRNFSREGSNSKLHRNYIHIPTGLMPKLKDLNAGQVQISITKIESMKSPEPIHRKNEKVALGPRVTQPARSAVTSPACVRMRDAIVEA